MQSKLYVPLGNGNVDGLAFSKKDTGELNKTPELSVCHSVLYQINKEVIGNNIRDGETRFDKGRAILAYKNQRHVILENKILRDG